MRFATVKSIGSRWLLPVATGALLAFALPPFNSGELGWLSLVPLLFAVEDCRLEEAFRRGYIAGLVFFGMTIWWIYHVTPAGTVGLIAFLALYFGAGAVVFVMANSLIPESADPEKQSGGWVAIRNILVAAVASAGWVTLEWLRGKLLFGGFPWNFLGVTQWQSGPLIQFASVTGVYGVSALVCFVNVVLYFTIRRFVVQVRTREKRWRLSWEFYVAMGLICLAFWQGLPQILRHSEVKQKTVRLALIQGDIPQTLKFEPEQKPMILERYRTLTETVMAARPEMIIWPETATPDALRYDRESFELVTNLAVKSSAYLFTGTVDLTPYSSPAEAFNGAILVRPDGTVGEIYHKIHLVPFGEYVPLRKIFPFMKWLTPIDGSFERGRDFTVFHAADLRFGGVICFEDTVPDLYRHFVRQDVDFMVNVTNDAWFKTSPAAEMHLANAIFRAIESRRPLVRASNSGVTCVVNEHGFVRARCASFSAGTLNFDLPLPNDRTKTFYTQYGDVFVGACAVVSVAAIGLAAFRRNRLESQI
ncbi:MAG TPA: apolipoprotein N-acyltransferase [Verrucomicrobiae bacterium]|nr:apolipoprotein N-acyltransferase [Verrucomicrobiae bacterium]